IKTKGREPAFAARRGSHGLDRGHLFLVGDARIEREVGHVDQEVDRHHGDGDEHHQVLHDRIVAPEDALGPGEPHQRIASTRKRATPGMLNTVSVTINPPTRNAASIPTMVTIGSTALRSACTKLTLA